MKKILIPVLVICLALLVYIKATTIKGMNLPFESSEIENVEMFHYVCVPVAAEKKTVTEKEDIESLYQLFNKISLRNVSSEETSTTCGDSVTGFRFHLTNDTVYEIIYVGTGKISSPTSDSVYTTFVRVEKYWDKMPYETVQAEESDLPKL